MRRPPPPTLSPYTTLFRSRSKRHQCELQSPGRTPRSCSARGAQCILLTWTLDLRAEVLAGLSSSCMARELQPEDRVRSEEHTSELQSQSNLVCRLLLEKKK